MAAPIVAGIAADLLSVHPEWTRGQVKGALSYDNGGVDENGDPDANMRRSADGAWEIAADRAMDAADHELAANAGLEPNELIDLAAGDIDYARASWWRASWRSIDGPVPEPERGRRVGKRK